MARFIVVHTPNPEITQDQLFEGARKIWTALDPGLQWLNTWSAGDANKVFCEWEAPDAETIRRILVQVEHIMSTDEIHAVVHIEPSLFK
ncbi:MAG: nickel-binding protein [Anaerolineae bacterium]